MTARTTGDQPTVPGADANQPPAEAVDETSPHVAIEPDGPDTGVGGGRRRKRVDKSLLLVSFAIGLGIMLVIRGLLIGVTGDERSNLPAEIERVDPVPDAVRVLAQTSVFVDLAPGYTGRLIVDGIEIETVAIDQINEVAEPGQQITLPPVTIYEPGNATLTFTPAAGAPIEEFGEGVHDATVIFWPIEQGEARSRSYRWTFNTV